MKYCWSLLITDFEDLADLKFYLQSLFHIIETVLEQIKTWSVFHCTKLYQSFSRRILFCTLMIENVDSLTDECV